MRAEARTSLLIAAAGAAAAVALATPSLPVVVRALGAGALGAVLPGAAIVAALMPWTRWHRSERLVLVLGASLTLTIATAFVLHLSPTGLAVRGWAGLLGALTVAAGLGGWIRGVRPIEGSAGAVADIDQQGSGTEAALRVPMVSPVALAMLGAAGLLVVVALVMARSGVALGPTASFTELWMLPTDDDRAVRVGIANHEGADRGYRLLVTVDGRRLGDPIDLRVGDGETSDTVLTIPATGAGPRQVEARLWHAEDAQGSAPWRLVRATLGSPADRP